MENADEEDDLKLVKASAGLLNDLEHDLPRLLFKQSKSHRRVHTRVKKRDLDRVANLVRYIFALALLLWLMEPVD